MKWVYRPGRAFPEVLSCPYCMHASFLGNKSPRINWFASKRWGVLPALEQG